MNIHDHLKDDDITGQIVGDMLSVGYLAYEGRKQRNTIYAANEKELKEKADGLRAEIVADMGEVFSMIYPSDNWRLIIVQ